MLYLVKQAKKGRKDEIKDAVTGYVYNDYSAAVSIDGNGFYRNCYIPDEHQSGVFGP